MKVTSTEVTSTKQGESLFGFRQLIAWQKADKLAHLVYDLTILFPKDEIYGITSQLRRAVLSIPTNIVEGHSRFNQNEFRRFLSIALGSLGEVEYLLEFAFQRGYINEVAYAEINHKRQEVGHILWKLYISQK